MLLGFCFVFFFFVCFEIFFGGWTSKIVARLWFKVESNRFGPRFNKIYIGRRPFPDGVLAFLEQILTAASGEDAVPLSSREALQFCQSNYTGIWFTILFSVKGAILLMGTYLSWETRNVTVPSMNDAKCIVLSVYTCVILVAMATALMAVLEKWPNAWYSCVSVVMLVCPTELLLLQYIPKIRALRNNPDASYSMSRSLTTSYLATSQHRSFAEVEEELFLLSKENASLKRALTEVGGQFIIFNVCKHVGSFILCGKRNTIQFSLSKLSPSSRLYTSRLLSFYHHLSHVRCIQQQ